MYSVNGDFGQVRLVNHPPAEQENGLFSPEIVGWHRCNDRYQFRYSQGRETHLLLFTVAGHGRMQVDGREYALPSGTVALIPRHTVGGYGTPTGGLWEFYWVHPRGDMANQFLDAVAAKGRLVNAGDPAHRYGERVERLMELCRQPAPDRLHLSHQLSELLHLTAVDLQEAPPAPILSSLSSRATLYIEQHFQKSLTVEEVARSLYVSPAHLIRVFKKETGVTPHQYLLHYRLLSAVQLLQFSDLQVKEIAAAVGFSSASRFIEHFRRRYGCTPLQYPNR